LPVQLEGLSYGTATYVRSPVDGITASDGEETLAHDQYSYIEALVRDILLQVDDRPQLAECLKHPPGNGVVVNTRDATSFAAEHRFNDDVAA
jgi:hypothetical protein